MSLPSDFLVTEHQFCRLPPKGLNGVMIKEKRRAGLPESGGLDGWMDEGMARDVTGNPTNLFPKSPAIFPWNPKPWE